MRDRACGAIIHEDRILMVRHVEDDGREYWTLPGGGIEKGETPAEAAEREVLEETGLRLTAERFLFATTNPRSGSQSHCFLMSVPGNPTDASLGFDPEHADRPAAERWLQDVEWHSLASQRDDVQVSNVIHALGNEGSE